MTASPPARAVRHSTGRPPASSPAVTASMRSNRGRDTRPELALRSAVHALGLRYRVGARPLPDLRRTADLVFRPVRIAVFLDGCFWHGCPEHHTVARAHASYWADKVRRNVDRDRDTDHRLVEAGWCVIRVWEHDDPHDAARHIAAAVTQRRSTPAGANRYEPDVRAASSSCERMSQPSAASSLR